MCGRTGAGKSSVSFFYSQHSSGFQYVSSYLSPCSALLSLSTVQSTLIPLIYRRLAFTTVCNWFLLSCCYLICCVLVRSAISIVPQSPDLFEGTLRENIDPVGEHSDVDIWIALDQVF